MPPQALLPRPHGPRKRSERKPAEKKPHIKRRKLDRIPVDREEVLQVDRAVLPADAQFQGYKEVVVEELCITTDPVKFRKEKFYSPSTGQTYLASLPPGYAGEYGPNVKSLCLLFSHLCNVIDPKIADLLANMGIVISRGPIGAWLTGGYPQLQEEQQAVVEAGLSSSAWHHIDDTGTRVDGENQHCHILCNPLYAAYFTMARKDRLTVLDVLRNGRERIFRISAEALDRLRQWGVSPGMVERVGQLAVGSGFQGERVRPLGADGRAPEASRR